MLAGQRLYTDILHRITIVAPHLAEDGLGMDERVLVAVDAQTGTYLSAYTVAACLKLCPVAIERGEIVQHLRTLVGMAARIFIGFYLVEVATLLPPVEVEVTADGCQRFLQRVGTDAEVGIGQLPAHGIYIVLEPHAPAPCHVVHHVVERACKMSLVCIGRCCRDFALSLRTCRQRHGCRDGCHTYYLFHLSSSFDILHWQRYLPSPLSGFL